MTDSVARELRRRILQRRLAVVEARRDRIAARLRALKLRESRRMTAAVLEDQASFRKSAGLPR